MNLSNIGNNWQTTLFGVATLIGTLAKVVKTKTLDANDMAAISAGVGLIVAKDSNVTGAK